MTDRPELQKDASGLWPGQRTPSDIPDFLDRRLLEQAAEVHKTVTKRIRTETRAERLPWEL